MIVGVGGLALFILLIALSTTVVGILYWTIVAVIGIEIGIENIIWTSNIRQIVIPWQRLWQRYATELM